VLHWKQAGRLELAATPTRVRLADLTDEDLGVDGLLSAAGVEVSWDRVVIGIDAPLGWLAEFVRLLSDTPRQTGPYLPGTGGETDNRLAYRFTDRVVYRRCGKKPLSAAFDKLGNNATKAITLCQLLRRNSSTIVVPQEEDDGQPVAICEADPALWKQDAARDGELIGPVADVVPREDMPALGTDEADAVLCALTAACYDNHVRGLGWTCQSCGCGRTSWPWRTASPTGRESWSRRSGSGSRSRCCITESEAIQPCPPGSATPRLPDMAEGNESVRL